MLYWVTGAILLVYLFVVWFFAGWLNPPGSGVLVLRIGLWLLGLLGAGFTAWWLRRQEKAAKGSDAGGGPSAATTEVDLLVRDAARKLKSSAMGRGASLRNLPLIFLVGDPGSAKTTSILHSALDPELLAGHVYQDNKVVPTRVANFWYTRQAVFVDGGGSLFSQPDLWRRLIKLVQPGRVASAGKQQQAPRAAIVCFDCESFLRPGAPEATLSAARRLGTRLLEISQLLGISFPIYVLFTRADRIGARDTGGSAFVDYVGGLTKDETSQVLGVTLPVRSLQATGVYADEETRRLEKAFDELFYSLSEKRIDLLSSANQAEKLPGIYEFPRELRKLRKTLVQFLVDLARPSQLSVNPFLRGFYFSGVRPTVIEDVAATLPEAQASDTGYGSNATVVFGAGGMRAPEPMATPRVSGSRKVPEWVFLSQLFNEVLLKDRVALSASGFSSRVSVFRRIAFASVIGIALTFAAGFLTSFIENSIQNSHVKQAVKDVRAIQTTPGQTPTTSQLQILDRLRQELEPLSAYHNPPKDIPWGLGWWLYSGDYFYGDVRAVYFDQFRTLLFGETQGKLLTVQNGSYEATYYPLKAYLLTTWNSDKNKGQGDFLPAKLYDTWAAGKTVDDPALPALVRRQFDFYSHELSIANPYPNAQSPVPAIARARAVLVNSGVNRQYYQQLRDGVNQKVQRADFCRQFDAHDLLACPHDVEGAFTADGFTQMQAAIDHKAIVSDDWVLNTQGSQKLDEASIRSQIRQQYIQDFIQQWRTVVQSTQFKAYGSLPDASAKLNKLSSTTNPIMSFFWFVSKNTSVDEPAITEAFQPFQSTVPSTTPFNQVTLGNEKYLDALGAVQSVIKVLADSPGSSDPQTVPVNIEKIEDAAKAVGTIKTRYHHNDFHMDDGATNLLKAPFVSAEAVVKKTPNGVGKEEGKSFCAELKELESFYPFDPKGADLPIDKLNSVFAPTSGSLWKLYSSHSLDKVLPKPYDPNGSGKVSRQFAEFFRRAAGVTSSLYGDSPTPHATYSVRLAHSDVGGITLKIGGTTVPDTGQTPLVWTGATTDEVHASLSGLSLGDHEGPWAIFKFISASIRTPNGTNTYDLEFVPQQNGKNINTGSKQTYTYEIKFQGGDPLLGFSKLGCVAP